MALPEREPGLVIPYAYLWAHERRRGLEEGRKTRPAVIVLAVREVGGRQVVTVAPVTHTAPPTGRHGLRLPPRVKSSLGLDTEPSWIMVDEVNRFIWPGYDVRSVPGRGDSFSYGVLPPALFAAVQRQLLSLYHRGRVVGVGRD